VELKRAGCVGIAGTVNLRPGINEIPASEWAAVESSASAQWYIAHGLVVVHGNQEAEAEAPIVDELPARTEEAIEEPAHVQQQMLPQQPQQHQPQHHQQYARNKSKRRGR
jgi:hypothetical protein